MRVPSNPTAAVLAILCLVSVSSCAGTSPQTPAAPADSGAAPPSHQELMEALAAARQQVQARTQDAHAWFQYGLSWQKLGTAGSADSAAAAYAQALEIEPDNVEARVHHGLALEELNRHEEAMAAYTKASNLAPDDALPYINLGSLLYFHYHKTYEAKQALTKALELDPDNADAHFNLGVLFADANMFREAKVEWEAALASAPEGSPARTLAEDNLARIAPILEAAGAPSNEL